MSRRTRRTTPNPVRLAVAALEARELPSADALTAWLDPQDVLRVTGTDTADRIAVTVTDGRVAVDGVRIGTPDGPVGSIPAAVVAGVRIDAGGGDDDIVVSGSWGVPVDVTPADGSDTLSAADRPPVAVGWYTQATLSPDGRLVTLSAAGRMGVDGVQQAGFVAGYRLEGPNLLVTMLDGSEYLAPVNRPWQLLGRNVAATVAAGGRLLTLAADGTVLADGSWVAAGKTALWTDPAGRIYLLDATGDLHRATGLGASWQLLGRKAAGVTTAGGEFALYGQTALWVRGTSARPMGTLADPVKSVEAVPEGAVVRTTTGGMYLARAGADSLLLLGQSVAKSVRAADGSWFVVARPTTTTNDLLVNGTVLRQNVRDFWFDDQNRLLVVDMTGALSRSAGAFGTGTWTGFGSFVGVSDTGGPWTAVTKSSTAYTYITSGGVSGTVPTTVAAVRSLQPYAGVWVSWLADNSLQFVADVTRGVNGPVLAVNVTTGFSTLNGTLSVSAVPATVVATPTAGGSLVRGPGGRLLLIPAGTTQLVEVSPAGRTLLTAIDTPAGVVVQFSDGATYFSPDYRNLAGGGATRLVYSGTGRVQEVVPYQGGYLVRFADGGLFYSSNLVAGLREILVATGVSFIRELPGGLFANNGNGNRLDLRVQPFGTFLLAAGGKVYSLAADGRATLVADNTQKLDSVAPFRGGLLSLFVDGRLYYSADPTIGLTGWLVKTGVPVYSAVQSSFVTADTSPVDGVLVKFADGVTYLLRDGDPNPVPAVSVEVVRVTAGGYSISQYQQPGQVAATQVGGPAGLLTAVTSPAGTRYSTAAAVLDARPFRGGLLVLFADGRLLHAADPRAGLTGLVVAEGVRQFAVAGDAFTVDGEPRGFATARGTLFTAADGLTYAATGGPAAVVYPGPKRLAGAADAGTGGLVVRFSDQTTYATASPTAPLDAAWLGTGLVKLVERPGGWYALQADGALLVNGVRRWVGVQDFSFDAAGRLTRFDRDGVITRSGTDPFAGGWQPLGRDAVKTAQASDGTWFVLQPDGSVLADGQKVLEGARDVWLGTDDHLFWVDRSVGALRRSLATLGRGGWEVIGYDVAKYARVPAGGWATLSAGGWLSAGGTGVAGVRDFAFDADGRLLRLGDDGRLLRTAAPFGAAPTWEVVAVGLAGFALDVDGRSVRLDEEVRLDGGTLTVTGGLTADTVTISPSGGYLTAVVNGRRSAPVAAALVKGVSVSTGGGKDTVDLSGLGVFAPWQGFSVRVDAGAGNDTVIGSQGPDVLIGGDGNDDLRGGDGNDTLVGGSGDDFLSGGAGNDVLVGGAGNDVLWGDAGDDQADGGDGDDVISGMDGNDVLAGGDGSDQINGGAGNDRIDAGAGNDVVWAGDGDDTVALGDGDDRGYGEGGNDVIAGMRGNDLIDGGAGNDNLMGGGGGNYSVWDDDGNDTLLGGDGDDRLDGGTGNDTLLGQAGNDTLLGQAGDDRLEGGVGDDLLFGGFGSDVLIGGDGNDVLDAGFTGSDVLDPDYDQSKGNDTYFVMGGASLQKLPDFRRLTRSGGGVVTVREANPGTDTLYYGATYRADGLPNPVGAVKDTLDDDGFFDKLGDVFAGIGKGFLDVAIGGFALDAASIFVLGDDWNEYAAIGAEVGVAVAGSFVTFGGSLYAYVGTQIALNVAGQAVDMALTGSGFSWSSLAGAAAGGAFTVLGGLATGSWTSLLDQVKDPGVWATFGSNMIGGAAGSVATALVSGSGIDFAGLAGSAASGLFAGLIGGSAGQPGVGDLGTQLGGNLTSWLVSSALSGTWDGYSLGRSLGSTAATSATTAAIGPQALAEAARRVASAAAAVADAVGDLFSAPPEARPYGMLASVQVPGLLASEGNGFARMMENSFKNVWNGILDKIEGEVLGFIDSLRPTPEPTSTPTPEPTSTPAPTVTLTDYDRLVARCYANAKAEILGSPPDDLLEMCRRIVNERLNQQLNDFHPPTSTPKPSDLMKFLKQSLPPALPPNVT